MDETSRWNLGELMRLGSAYWASSTLFAALRLGVPSALIERKQTGASAEELARVLGCSLRGMAALLDGLAAIELVVKHDGRYRLHPELEPLLTPGHLLDRTNILMHMGDLVHHWDRLDGVVKQGYPTEWSMEDGKMSPEFAAHYYRGMSDVARVQAKGLAARLGLRPGQHLLDLGGGHGHYAYTFADETPGLRATVYDLPGARPFFEEQRAGHAHAANVDFREGDFTDASLDLGGPYDVAWLSQILHIEGPKVCTQLLTATGAALKPGGVVWIQEFIVEDDRTAPVWPALFNINMLLHNRDGKAYSRAELRAMMTNAGLTDITFEGSPHPGALSSLMRGVTP